MAEERYNMVWNNCLKIISQIVEPQHYNTWFKPVHAVAIEGSTLELEVPSEFFREYLEEYYLDVLKKTLRRVIGADAKLVYRVRPVTAEPPMRYPVAPGTAPVNKTISITTYPHGNNPGPFVYPGLQRVQVNPQLNPVYCFSNLVEGECNKMGITAGESISSAPGKTAFNPLFLFGQPGLGKTHIAQAIGIAIKEKYPEQLWMADCSTVEEALHADELGFDFIGTTLVGYTKQSRDLKIEANDFEVLRTILDQVKHPVIAEGNVNTPEKARRVLELGAYSVVVGSAITRPQLITKSFAEALEA